MSTSRRKSVFIKLNIDELYLLGERVIWKMNSFLNLKYHICDNKEVRKKLKSYLSILKKLTHLDIPRNILSDITIKLTPNEVLLLWEAINRIESEYADLLKYIDRSEDLIFDIIDNVNRCNITYKDLSYYQAIYIYLYTELAICMRNSGNQNIYIDGPLLVVRNTYIIEHLSDLRCVFEFDSVDFTDLNRFLYIIEPRYTEPNSTPFDLTKYSIEDILHIFNITQGELDKAQSFIESATLDYAYLQSISSDFNADNLEYLDNYVDSERLDNLESDINEANFTLSHSSYGPGWRVCVQFFDYYDINGIPDSDINLDVDTIIRLKELKLFNLNKSIIDKNTLSLYSSEKLKLIDQLKSDYNRLYYTICISGQAENVLL